MMLLDALLRLQFGHGFIAVETAKVAAYRAKEIALQFGHGFIAVETSA